MFLKKFKLKYFPTVPKEVHPEGFIHFQRLIPVLVLPILTEFFI